MFIVCFLLSEYKLHKGRDFYLFGFLVHARWSVNIFSSNKDMMCNFKVSQHIS